MNAMKDAAREILEGTPHSDGMLARSSADREASLKKPAALSEVRKPPPASGGGKLAKRSMDFQTWFAAVTIFLAVLAALVPGLLAPYSPTAMMSDAVLGRPSLAHWFGTDQFGRDVLTLVIFGARQSLLLGLSATILGATIGVAIGLIAGYAGGWIDMVIMRVIDIYMAVPGLLLAITLATALGPSLMTTVFSVSIAFIPRYSRVLRGQALAVRAQPFVLAARANGASHLAIVRRHLLRHCAGPILVMVTLGVGNSILIGSGLSFLGLGVNDDYPDWGFLLSQGRGYMSVAWWTVTYPGAAIALLVISVNWLGDALRRRLDPHSVRRR